MPAPKVTAVVPTLGRSPLLGACLQSIRHAGGSNVEIVVVDQTDRPGALEAACPDGLRMDRVLRPGAEKPLGFAAANNLAFVASETAYIATINDDATVDEDWLDRLLDVMHADATLAAAQGTNLDMTTTPRIDGRGIGWNRWWQAVQHQRGQAPTQAAPTIEVFGVSATAALFRRSALDAVAQDGLGPAGSYFDPQLGSYYEDVDLAGRLRSQGWSACCVPAARAHHAGSTTGRTLPQRSLPWIYANRHLSLARLLGRSYWPRLPRLLLRDLADLWQSRRDGDAEAVTGIALGLRRAARLMPAFASFRPPLISLADLRRFMANEAR